MVSFQSICFINAKHLYCILTILVSIRYSYGSLNVLTYQNKVLSPKTKVKVVKGVTLHLSYKHRCIYHQGLFCFIVYIRTEYKYVVRKRWSFHGNDVPCCLYNPSNVYSCFIRPKDSLAHGTNHAISRHTQCHVII